MLESDEILLSPSDIAQMAAVTPAAVSNWRKRFPDFPAPVSGSPAKPLFERRDVVSWLERRNLGNQPRDDGGLTDIWGSLNRLRGQVPPNELASLLVATAATRLGADVLTRDRSDSGWVRAADILGEAVGRLPEEALADTVDSVLERIARSQGKLGADLGFIGSRTSTLLATLAASHAGRVLYDPACGIGTALIDSIGQGARPERVVGHDLNQWALEIAERRALLRGFRLELTQTDVLAEDVDPGLLADVIVLEPPFGIKMAAQVRLADPRFAFGTPPASSADTAWIQHVIAHLSEAGRGYVITPMGLLSRSGQEREIRASLIRQGCVEAVVSLPGKMLPHTAIPLALWVLRRPVQSPLSDPIVFIDATKDDVPEDHVAEWLNNTTADPTVPRAEIALADVLADGALLAPQRWIGQPGPASSELSSAYVEGWSEVRETAQKLRNVLAAFEHVTNVAPSRTVTVGELVDQGVLELRQGRPADKYESAPAALRARIATARAVRDGTIDPVGLDGDFPDFPELTEEGDVLVTTMNMIRARVDEAGGHLPSTGVYRLRVKDRSVLSPWYLAAVLPGRWNDLLQTGSTIQRAPVKDLQVPILPRSDQTNIEMAAMAIDLMREHAAKLVSEAEDVRSALLDAVRYNATIEIDNAAVGGAEQDGRDHRGAK